jgi:uncharacterized protein (TIGR02300 family)
VAKAELGMKLTCDSCGARFYDLNKTPGICPKCGTANARPVIFKASRRPAEDREKAAAAAAAAAKAAKPVVDEDDVEVPADDDEDEAVIEDTSDLGEDDDDVAVPVEKDEA